MMSLSLGFQRQQTCYHFRIPTQMAGPMSQSCSVNGAQKQCNECNLSSRSSRERYNSACKLFEITSGKGHTIIFIILIGSSGGIDTAFIAWITPLLALTSVFIIFAFPTTLHAL